MSTTESFNDRLAKLSGIALLVNTYKSRLSMWDQRLNWSRHILVVMFFGQNTMVLLRMVSHAAMPVNVLPAPHGSTMIPDERGHRRENRVKNERIDSTSHTFLHRLIKKNDFKCFIFFCQIDIRHEKSKTRRNTWSGTIVTKHFVQCHGLVVSECSGVRRTQADL